MPRGRIRDSAGGKPLVQESVSAFHPLYRNLQNFKNRGVKNRTMLVWCACMQMAWPYASAY